MSGILKIIVAIILPPLAVAMTSGIGRDFFLNILLTLLGWLPGVIHAIFFTK